MDAEPSAVRSQYGRSGSSDDDSSNGSVRGAPSEDWSVISEQDDRRSSFGSKRSVSRNESVKRTSFTAAMLSVLPDAFVAGSPRSRRRSLPTS